MTHGVIFFRDFHPITRGCERSEGYSPVEPQKTEVRLARPDEIHFDPERAKELTKKGRTIESASLHGGGT